MIYDAIKSIVNYILTQLENLQKNIHVSAMIRYALVHIHKEENMYTNLTTNDHDIYDVCYSQSIVYGLVIQT